MQPWAYKARYFDIETISREYKLPMLAMEDPNANGSMLKYHDKDIRKCSSSNFYIIVTAHNILQTKWFRVQSSSNLVQGYLKAP